MSNLSSLSLFWPELILTATVIFSLIADLVYGKKESYKTAYWTITGLIIAGLLVLNSPQQTASLFMNTIAHDPFANFFKILILVASILVILVSLKNKELQSYGVGEYYTVLTILILGLFLLVSSIDILMVYISLETVSLMSYFLAGYLKRSNRSTEASLKYVIYGAVSSGIMLFGLSLLFGLTGSTNFLEIQSSLSNSAGGNELVLILAAVFIIAGFGYKISAVPFHFWTPDVYEGSPTTITAYLSVAPKAAGFALIIRFFNQVFADNSAFIAQSWSALPNLPWPQVLALLAAATMTLGNLVAVQQKSVKRMLAYSSIAHAGYMMMGLPLLSSQGIFGIMIYLVFYLIMNLGAFFVLIYVKNKTNGENFNDFTGLGWKMPFVGIVLALFMFSLTGLPPTAGFIGKFYIFAAVIKAGSQFYWLAFVGIINSVISLYYYLRVVKHMFLRGEPVEAVTRPDKLFTIIFLILGISTLIFGLYWEPVANWVSNSMIFLK